MSAFGVYPDETDAFRRAFERDKDDLRAMGVPLEFETVPGVVPAVEGYRIPKDRYYLRDPGLTPDSSPPCASRPRSCSSTACPPARASSSWAGSSAIRATPATPGSAWRCGSLPGGNVAPLFGAIAAHVAVRFTYRSEVRTVDPYRLDFARGRWYLSGYDHARRAERVFRLDRFESATEALHDAGFERPAVAVPGVQLDPWTIGEGEPVEARVLVDAAQAPWIVQHLGPGAVAEERPDGSVVVTMAVTNRDNFRFFVLTFLDHAEVLEPADLRGEVVGWLEKQAA